MGAFSRALSKVISYFQFQKLQGRDIEYDDISADTLLSLMTENLNRLTMDLAVYREKVKDGKRDSEQTEASPN